jgi:HB1/ASXL restriction endonuclease-like protein with HTH domain
LTSLVCFPKIKLENKLGGVMTVQEAAHKILKEVGEPVSAKEIAQRALTRGYVASSAKDPVFSIGSTIEKTIREDKYNSPRLVFIRTRHGRKIGLPSMEIDNKHEKKASLNHHSVSKRRLNVELPEELIERIQLASQAKIAATYDDTVALLLKKGLSASAPEIRKRLLSQLDNI